MKISTDSFLSAIAGVCRKSPVPEKWLVAPSLRIGAQWVDRVAWSGQPVLNLRVKTLRGIALEVAQPQLSRLDLTPLSDRGAALVVERLFARLQPRLEYFGPLKVAGRLAETMHRSLKSLRLANVTPSQLKPGSFETASKGQEIALLLDAYEARLSELKLADAPEILRLAVEALRGKTVSLPNDLIVLAPESLEANSLERGLLEALGAALVRSNPPSRDNPTTSTSDLELIRFFREPWNAPAPRGDGSFQVFAAAGEANEVRETLRRIAVGGFPLDQVEVLHTDSEVYVPLFYETLLSLQSAALQGELEAPATFAEGIPCRYSRPGRALSAWAAWVRQDYPQAALVKMVRDGLLAGVDRGSNTDTEAPEEVSFHRLAATLRSLGIGFGRDRYLPKIDESIEALQRLARDRAALSDGEEDPEESQGVLSSTPARLLMAQGLRALVARLLQHTPSTKAPATEILGKAKALLEDVASAATELDQYARRKLLDEIEDMLQWVSLEPEAVSFDALEWLTALPARTSVMGSGPRPGRLHVAPLLSGGHSGRGHTFILGLDDSRFPRSGLQDPLLLDSERKALSSTLSTSGDRQNRDVEELSRLLERLDGQATFSYSRLSLSEDCDLFPSPELLTLYRLATGDRNADLSTIAAKLGPKSASFAPQSPERALNGLECWLSAFCGQVDISNKAEIFKARFPHLDRGRDALAARLRSTSLTEFDGHVPEAGRQLDPMAAEPKAVSASGLETAGKCPLRYFFKYGLRVEKPQDVEVDPNRWLDPLNQGKLLHLVFEEFVRGWILRKTPPRRDRDRSEIRAILSKYVESFRKILPPPNEAAYASQIRDFQKTVETFLVEEEAYAKRCNAEPVYLEASLGLASEEHESGLDCSQPLVFSLGEGQRIKVRGRIDRIDLLGGGACRTYAIWDYKTGGLRQFSKERQKPTGRVLQPALYVSMVEHRLREKVARDAEVAFFGFFFPGTRGEGERLQWAKEELEVQRALVESICQTIRNGTFLPTTDKEECRYCDYLEACGDTEQLTLASKAKIKLGGEVVRPLLKTISNDD